MSGHNLTPVDVSTVLDVFDIPCCPLCGNEIRNGWGDVAIAEHSESLCLIHAECARREFGERRQDN